MFTSKNLLFFAAAAFALIQLSSGQRQWVPPTTTAAEMWNGYTWYWPYAIAGAEAYREWFTNAQQITNQLYQQAYITGAFSQGPSGPQFPPQNPPQNVPRNPPQNVPQNPPQVG